MHTQEVKSILTRAFQEEPIVHEAIPVYSPKKGDMGNLIFPKVAILECILTH